MFHSMYVYIIMINISNCDNIMMYLKKLCDMRIIKIELLVTNAVMYRIYDWIDFFMSYNGNELFVVNSKMVYVFIEKYELVLWHSKVRIKVMFY